MKNIFNLIKIKTRLIVLAGLMGAVIVVLTAWSTFSTNNLASTLTQLNTSLLPGVNNVRQLQYNLAMIDRHFQLGDATALRQQEIEEALLDEIEFLSGVNSSEATDRIRKLEETLEANVEALVEHVVEMENTIDLYEEINDTLIPSIQAVFSSEDGMKIFENFYVKFSSFRQLREDTMELFWAGHEDEARELFFQALIAGSDVVDVLHELVDYSVEISDSASNTGVRLANNSVQISVILSGVLLIVSAIMLISIINSITKPINILKSKLTQIASGDLTIEIPVGYKAEFGEMFESFKEMLGNLNGLILGVKGMSGNVQGSFSGVKSGLEKMSDSMVETDSFLRELVTDMGNQVAGLKESAVAMGHIASGIQQIAESSTTVSELATETSTQATDGSAVIKKSVAQMKTINQVVEDTSGVVDRFVKRTKTIDEALKAITAIAEQTNLLALNASIEAARAGEQGRGFAVVAEEVSKLADQSKESANEINALLQEINADTTEAVKAMEQGKLEAKQGIEVINQAGQAFSSIVEQVTTMTEQIQEVSSTVEEMSAGTEEVNSSVVNMVSSSETIATHAMEAVRKYNAENEMAEKFVSVMNEANEEVGHLEEGLNKFKTEEKNGE